MMPIAKIPRGRASAKLGRRPTGTTARGGSWRASAKARGGERTIHARTGGYGGRGCSTRDDEISGLMSGEDSTGSPRRSPRARGVSTSPFAVGASQRGASIRSSPLPRRFARRRGRRASHSPCEGCRTARACRIPVGASRCAALPARARPGNIALAESNNDRLEGASDASTSPSFPARSRSSHSRGVRVPTERRRRGFGRGRGREVVHDVPPATSGTHPLPPTGTPSAGPMSEEEMGSGDVAAWATD